MSGDWLAVGAVAAVAVAGLVRRGSANLPSVGDPKAGTKPRWEHSWKKGGAWAREQISKSSMTDLGDKDRTHLENNVLRARDMNSFSRMLVAYTTHIQPEAIATARRLYNVGAEKEREYLTVDQRAFWDGVRAYSTKVIGWWTGESNESAWQDFHDDVEFALFRAWKETRR